MDKLRSILLMWTIFFAVLLLFIPLFYTAPASMPKFPKISLGKAQTAEGVFIEGSYGGDGETLNFLLASDATSFSYIGHTLDSLATYNNKLELHLLCLAKDVEVSEDGLTYTVTIRDDLKWSDGSSVTADDYVYTMKNLMFSDWLNYPYRDSWQEEVDGKTVLVQPEVVNDTTFIIRRQTVDPEFVYTIYDLVPYPRYIATKYEGDVDAFTQAPEFNELSYTGNLGPYRFKEWIRNDRYVVERNPEYYLGKNIGAPYFQQYVVKQFGTSATTQAALEASDITMTGIEPEKVSRFKEMKNINVYTVPSGGYNLLAYNQRKNSWEGMQQTAVRQALSMAISKETICQKIYLGFAEPAYSFIPVVSPWYDAKSVVKYGVGALYDKQKAVEQFAQAGYARKDTAGKWIIASKDGTPVKLILVTTTGGGLAEDIAYLVKQELSEIGIEVEIKLVPWENILRQYMMNKVPGSDQTPRDNNGPDAVSEEPWDMILMGFGTDVMAPSGSRVFFTSDGGLNFIGYYNPAIDALFQRIMLREALDKDVRAKIYAEISKTLSQEQPVDFLVFRRSNIGFQSNVKGVEPGISMGYNYYLWHFE